MRRLNHALILGTVGLTLAAGSSFAQDHYDDRDRNRDHRHEHRQRYVRHDEWRKGEHIGHEDWDRGYRVDYRQYHLRRPPRGYEWREVDGNFVMAAIATGAIASVIAATAIH